MEVRPARPDEAAAVVQCLTWLFAPPGGQPPDWDVDVARDRALAWIEGPRSTVLVTDDLSGVCTVALDIESIRFGRRAWVEDLAVDPTRRSEGHGKALLDAAKAWALAQGANHLELESGDRRTDAHRFYEREQPFWTSRAFCWVLS